MNRLFRAPLLLLLAPLALACGDDPSGPGRSEPGIAILAGAELVDTVQAVPVQALRVRVVDVDGKTRSGMVVRFESLAPAAGSATWSGVHVGPLASASFGSFATDTTGPEGEAAVRVRLGTSAGAGGVVVSVPILGFQDTARYTIQPGAAARIVVAPSDSTISVGAAYPLRSTVADRFGNPRSDPVVYAAVSGPISVDAAAATVRGNGVGRGVLVARSGGAADTGHVTVTPPGMLAVTTARGVAVMNLDGSGYRELYSGPAANPVWDPAGRTIVFGSHDGRLRSVDLSGTVRPLIAADSSPAPHLWPHFSRDGQWVYFMSSSGRQLVWRVRASGTGLQRITPPTGSFLSEGRPTPSPDDRRLALYSGGGLGTTVRIRDLATGSLGAPLAVGHVPAWSPVDDLIAFNGIEGYDRGSIRLVRSDGSGLRELAPARNAYAFGHSWSPDGRWIVARSTVSGLLDLIDVASGQILPLAFTREVREASWRPESP